MEQEEYYVVSDNEGLTAIDYIAYQAFDKKRDVVAIVRIERPDAREVGDFKLLELQEVRESLIKEALLNAIKERFPSIKIKSFQYISAEEREN